MTKVATSRPCDAPPQPTKDRGRDKTRMAAIMAMTVPPCIGATTSPDRSKTQKSAAIRLPILFLGIEILRDATTLLSSRGIAPLLDFRAHHSRLAFPASRMKIPYRNRDKLRTCQ